jgi:hypothetical protein
MIASHSAAAQRLNLVYEQKRKTAWVLVFQQRAGALPPIGICSYLSELDIQAYAASNSARRSSTLVERRDCLFRCLRCFAATRRPELWLTGERREPIWPHTSVNDSGLNSLRWVTVNETNRADTSRSARDRRILSIAFTAS